jgi:hypothetical protein
MKTKKITLFSILWAIICMCVSAVVYTLKIGIGAWGAPATMMAADHTAKEVKGWYENL